MAVLTWDGIGDRKYETGVSKGVLFVQDVDNESTEKRSGYKKGVPWNGLTAVTESPSGAEASDLYADNIKYASMRSAETFGCTIEAYTYPDEFGVCDGTEEPVAGLYLGQQRRVPFAFSYRTEQGDDTSSEADRGYKIHIVYGATASPSDKGYSTVNDSPEAITLSWEVETTPVAVTGFKPTALITIDSTKLTADNMKAIEDKLYGTAETESTLLLPDELIDLIKG